MKTRTLLIAVTFGMTCIADAEVFEEIAKGREQARKATPEKLAELDKGDLYKHSLLVSDKTDEEILNQVLRMSTREFLRDYIPREFSGGGLRAKMGDITVAVTPKKVTPRIDCIHCRVLEGAGQTYKCSTCRNMTEVK